jgi:hypothetical protein
MNVCTTHRLTLCFDAHWLDFTPIQNLGQFLHTILNRRQMGPKRMTDNCGPAVPKRKKLTEVKKQKRPNRRVLNVELHSINRYFAGNCPVLLDQRISAGFKFSKAHQYFF